MSGPQITYFVNIYQGKIKKSAVHISFWTLRHLSEESVYIENTTLNTKGPRSVGKGGDCTWRCIIKHQKLGGATACSHFEEIPPGLKLDHKDKILHYDYTRTISTVPNRLSHSISVYIAQPVSQVRARKNLHSWIAQEANNHANNIFVH